MLHALKSQLVLLSENKPEEFRNALKRRIGLRRGKEVENDLRNFILVIPEMLAQIRAWVADPQVPRTLRQMHGYLLTYLYHPADFLSEEQYGLFGYLDDAYLVGCAYFQTLQAIDRTQVRFLPNQADLSTQVPAWITTTQKAIPAESRKIEALLRQLRDGDIDIFDRMMHAS